MVYCEKLYEGLDRRLDEKKDIDTIAEELCNGVVKKRYKIIKLIKSHKGGDYLFDNSEWLGYRKDMIHNMSGNRGIPKAEKETRLYKPSLLTKKPPKNKYEGWVETLTEMCLVVDEMNIDFENTTEARQIWKLNGLNKRIRELIMILKTNGRIE